MPGEPSSWFDRAMSPEAPASFDIAKRRGELPCGLDGRDEARNYFDFIAGLFGELGGTVLDHGAGSGALSERLLNGAERVIALEPDPELVDLLAERFARAPRLEVLPGTIETYLAERGPGTLDAIVSSNVLEHIVNDVECLERIREALKPAGVLGVYVPARQELFGSLDAAVGHVRRYARSELSQKLARAGFRVEWVRYRNIAGVVPWLVAGKLLRRRAVGARNIGLFDRLIFPASQLVEARIELPYGLNLAARARRI